MITFRVIQGDDSLTPPEGCALNYNERGSFIQFVIEAPVYPSYPSLQSWLDSLERSDDRLLTTTLSNFKRSIAASDYAWVAHLQRRLFSAFDFAQIPLDFSFDRASIQSATIFANGTCDEQGYRLVATSEKMIIQACDLGFEIIQANSAIIEIIKG
jgi:hypothetical protein